MKSFGVAIVLAAVTLAQTPPPSQTPQTPGAQQGGRGGPQQPPRDPPAEFFSKNEPKGLVEFELMTWPEVYRAIHKRGKTTALIYFGGTEHRGPQNVNGGHTIMGRAIVKEIALKLGNAIALPVIPYSQNNASAQTTGTLGLTDEIQATSASRSPSRRSPPASPTSSSSTITAAAQRLRRGREEARGQVPRARTGVAQHPRVLRRYGLRQGAGRLRQVAQGEQPAGQRPRRHSRHVDDDVPAGAGQEAERVHAARPAAGRGHGAGSDGPERAACRSRPASPATAVSRTSSTARWRWTSRSTTP